MKAQSWLPSSYNIASILGHPVFYKVCIQCVYCVIEIYWRSGRFDPSIKDSNARKSNNFPVNFGDVCGI